MARPLRIQYFGAVYYITCLGNEGKEIFKEALDRETFLEILTQSAKTYNIKIYSYILMENHFHLLIETPFGNVGEFMRHFNITYTGYYNRRHKRVGHLYQGRYKSILVEKETYLCMLSRYIHLNPVRTKVMEKKAYKKKVQYLEGYKWSSLPGYISNSEREGFIDYEMILGEYGGDNKRGRTAYKEQIFSDIGVDFNIKEKIIGQSILGGDKFIGWVRDNFLQKGKDRECPSLKEIQRYKAEEEILEAIKQEIGQDIESIMAEKGSIRQIAMDLLYRRGGLTGAEIGRMMGVDYSTVSQGRKRLREKLQKDKELMQVLSRIEAKLSI